jgi:hypothetical protein
VHPRTAMRLLETTRRASHVRRRARTANAKKRAQARQGASDGGNTSRVAVADPENHAHHGIRGR